MHILFGSPLGISISDVRQTILICLIVVGVLVIYRRDLMLYCFDPTHARSIGINTGILHYLLLSVLSLAAVAGLQTVGIILVVAMLITPGQTHRVAFGNDLAIAGIAILCSKPEAVGRTIVQIGPCFCSRILS